MYMSNEDSLNGKNAENALADPSDLLYIVSHTPDPAGPPLLSGQGLNPATDLHGKGSAFSTAAHVESEDGELNTSGVAQTSGWDQWVKDYSRGKWPSNDIPSPPAAISAVLSGSHNEHHSESVSPMMPSTPSSPGMTATEGSFEIYPVKSSSSASTTSHEHIVTSSGQLLDFYEKNGYFPAPKPEFEAERLRTMKRYGLDQPFRRKAVERVCRIAKTHFQTSTVIISLVFQDSQFLAAECGWTPGVEVPAGGPVRELPVIESLCAHAMTKTQQSSPDETFVVPDASKDWRFKNNPYQKENGGILSFYASANIRLPTQMAAFTENQLEPAAPSTLPVGSLCVIDDRPRDREAFTLEDKTFLHDLADMVAREFQLGYEQRRRTVESSQASFIGSFLSSTMEQPPTATIPRNAATASPPHQSYETTAQHSPLSYHGFSGHDPSYKSPELVAALQQDAFHCAANQLRVLTSASSAAILDVRSFRAPLRNAPLVTPRNCISVKGVEDDSNNYEHNSPHPTPHYDNSIADPTNYIDANYSHFRTGKGSIYLMASDGEVDWEFIVKNDCLAGEIVEALRFYYDTGITQFDEKSIHSPLKSVLPENTSSSFLVPIFDFDSVPALILILSSSQKNFSFEQEDQQFIQNVGAVAMGSLLRQRAAAADLAKLAFVSQISHELRTPLHGINSQVELIREFSSPAELIKLSPLLDVAEVCLESLRDVLDDTLDFAKLSNHSPSEIAAAHKRSLVKADLLVLAEDVAKATWVRKRQVDLVSKDAQGGKGLASQDLTGKVDIILEYQQLPGGWNVWVDPGGMKRVLLNLLGNGLKFTRQGHVKFTLREIPTQAGVKDGSRLVTIEIEDTGCGMSEDFLKDGKLFTPFVQENQFMNGAGLGMSICDTIVRRMGGKIDVTSALGKGTTIRITLPIHFSAPDAAPSAPTEDSSRRGESSWTGGVPVVRRVISDELSVLFTAGQRSTSFHPETSSTGLEAKLSPSPLSQYNHFSDAIENKNASFGRTFLVRTPSAKSQDIAANPLKTLDVDEAVPRSNGGDTSSLRVPPTRAADNNHSNNTINNVALSKNSPAPNVNVLVADDNTIARNILTKLLTGKGIPFVQAADGQQAIDAYKRGSFNLAIIDYQMPIKDGLQAAVEIREYEQAHNLPRCRIVALSGLSNESDLQKAGMFSADGPMDAWLVKGGKSLRLVIQEITTLEAQLSNC